MIIGNRREYSILNGSVTVINNSLRGSTTAVSGGSGIASVQKQSGVPFVSVYAPRPSQ